MALRYWYQKNDGTVGEMTDRINDPLRVTVQAEEGVAGSSQIRVHDPLGDFDIRGHRKVWATEDAIADTSNRTLFRAYTSQRHIERGSPFVGRARDWMLDIFDINTLLDRRIMVGADCKRPAETDVARMRWLVGTTEMNQFVDDDFIFPSNPTDMDECDYTGQSAKNIIDDCAQQSGRNYYAFNMDTGDASTGISSVHDAHVWYGHDSLEDREADVRISNVASDIDGTTTLAPDADPKMDRSPDRVFSGAFVAYAKGYVMVTKQSTALDFAPRDVTSPAQNVKTKAKAIARGNRYLNTADTEEDVIECAITVPASMANCAQEGERIEVRFEHLPGYEIAFTFMRIVQRTIEQLSAGEYRLSLKLSAPAPVAASVPVYGVLRGSGGPYDTENGSNLVHWANPGDTPGPGYNLEPTIGPLTMLTDATPPKDNRTHWGWRVDGDGNIDVTTYCSVYGILKEGIDYTWTIAICKNGTPVVSEDLEVAAPVGSNLWGQGWDPTISIDDLTVADGDEITVTLDATPSLPFFWRTPRGTGQNGERLEITGGSLA